MHDKHDPNPFFERQNDPASYEIDISTYFDADGKKTPSGFGTWNFRNLYSGEVVTIKDDYTVAERDMRRQVPDETLCHWQLWPAGSPPPEDLDEPR